MRLHELYENLVKQYDLYQAQIKVQQPGYFGRITVTVSAPSAAAARALIRAQYNVKTHDIQAVRRVPAGKQLT